MAEVAERAQGAGVEIEQRWLPYFFWTFCLALLVLAWSYNVVDIDMWHEMALARYAVGTGRLPAQDPFAYTPTTEFVHHEWGAGLVAYWVAERFGGGGIMALKLALTFGMALFALLRVRQDKPSLPAMMLAIPTGILILQPGYTTIRAQAYSMLFMAILLWLLALDSNGKKLVLWCWPALWVLWVNLHGGFVVAFGVLAAEWLERRLSLRPRRHLLALGAAMLVLVGATPYGLRYYSFITHSITMARPQIKEWQPLWHMWELRRMAGIELAMFAISCPVLVYVLRVTKLRNLRGWVLLLLLLAASLHTTRMLIFYGLAWLIVAPGALAHTPLGQRWKSVRPGIAAVLLVVFASFSFVCVNSAWAFAPWNVVVPTKPIRVYGYPVYYPAGVVKYLRRHEFNGNLMVYYPLGGYVSWRLFPRVKVSMDSRYEVAYPAWLVEENFEFYGPGKNWREVLGAYPTDAVLVYRPSSLCSSLGAADGWKPIYEDDYFALFGRRDSRLPVESHRGEIIEDTFP